MRELRRLFLLVLCLTFVGGLGTGAWVGTLTAAPSSGGVDGLDQRVAEFNSHLGLDPAQERRLKEILSRHDQETRSVRDRLNAEQFREIQSIHGDGQRQIRQMLDERQRRIYDQLVGGR